MTLPDPAGELPSTPDVPLTACAHCGVPFTCGTAAGVSPCWCASHPGVMPVPPAGSSERCLCPACLSGHVREENPGSGRRPRS